MEAQTKEMKYEDVYQDLVSYSRQVAAKGEGDFVWVVHFWASWQKDSKDQIAELQALATRYKNRPLRIVSISVDKVESEWKRARGQYEMPWVHTRIPGADDYEFLKQAFRHNSLPALFIIDSRAKVRRIRDSRELVTSLVKAVPESDVSMGSTTSTPPPAIPPQATGDWVYHTVQAQETLYSLYRRYGVPVNDIKRINGLTSNNIAIGQRLKIKRQTN